MIHGGLHADLGDLFLRLGTAVFLGGALGLNRELHDKPAGLRTQALVCLGAAAATRLGLDIAAEGNVVDMGSVTRVIQGVLTGIGFLGAGVIFREDRGKRVRGLTTSAGILVVAAMGMACGAGRLRLALVAFTLTFAVLLLGGPLERAAEGRVRARRTDPPG